MYYNGNDYGPRTYAEQYDAIRGLNNYIAKVFGWMFVGLLLTAGVGYYVAGNIRLFFAILGNPIILIALLIFEIALVSVLSARITRLSFGAAVAMFAAYAVINGLTFSVIFLAYDAGSIATAFGTTAITFGIMCLYGYFTRNDLTRFRTILFMGLIGILVLSLVNIFLASSSVDWLICIVSLFVFLGLTAYDMQKLKAFYFGTDGDVALRNNLGIIGALQLYLDFINLFLTLLRLLGGRNRR